MKVAVIGLFHRECFYIPYWQNYYGKLFSLSNLYVVGNLETDESMKLFDRQVNKINYVPNYFADHQEHTQIIINLQNQLLQTHEVVIFAEADQFFVPDPNKYLNLNDYLYQNNNDYIKVSGWNVRHSIDEEPCFNPNERILAQRKYWFKDAGPEDKMVIVRKPVQWYDVGFHHSQPDVARDPDLYNIHFQKFDFNTCNARFASKTFTQNWHPASGKHGLGSHVWKNDDELYQDWMEENKTLKLELIPDRFRDLPFI